MSEDNEHPSGSEVTPTAPGVEPAAPENPAVHEALAGPGPEAPARDYAGGEQSARLGPWASRYLGPFLVAGAAALWATDALFRLPVLQTLSPATVVLAEHTLALAVLLPWAILRRHTLLDMTFKEWLSALITGAGGSAIATVLFTASFKYVNPSVAILLQKLQPILTVSLAFFFLGDRPKSAFFMWAPMALLSGLVVSFPDLDFRFLFDEVGSDARSRGVAYALGAAALWAAATVAGKVLLSRISSFRATFWRFWFGWATLLAIQLVGRIETPWHAFEDAALLKSLAYMALGPGLGAVSLYYLGLKRTHASTATFVELIFPVTAVVLNSVFLNLPLLPVQVLAGSLLLLSVTQISLKGH
ncbi:MAG TPA: DMT family transporter [Bdellovibrionota bacterium]|jgi:drug/metabolite transporter (DMT)-like permease|nr:DMT family transporter [Bdellovibrionota bacterium]